MTYEIFKNIFFVSASLSGVMLIVTVFLFITLKIPKIFNDITGRTAKKEIKRIKEQNIRLGEKKVSSHNQNDTTDLEETTILEEVYNKEEAGVDNTIMFDIEYDITYIHTNEIID